MDEERQENQEQEAQPDARPATSGEPTPTVPPEPEAKPQPEPEPQITLEEPAKPTTAVGVKRMGLRKALLGKASLIGAAIVLVVFLLLLLANRDEYAGIQFLWARGGWSTASVLILGLVCGALLVLLLGLAFRVGKVRVSYGGGRDQEGDG